MLYLYNLSIVIVIKKVYNISDEICVYCENHLIMTAFAAVGRREQNMRYDNSDYFWIHDMLNELSSAPSEKECTEILERYRSSHTSEFDRLVIADTEELIKSDKINSTVNHKLSALSDSELAELEETEHIIDENLFDYYFQPIVNTTDGEIYSYEALMRPKSTMKLTPMHILKYAGIMDRLADIERGTFMNVLGIIDLHKNKFSGKFVFINSIPEVKLNADDFKNVTGMLLKHADTAVVEMTEQSQVDDESLETLKERYRNMGVRMAIDDYGTGYSNVGNLLRYMPNFVKIDRSLLSEIQKSPKKRHFVREIIQFCHDNDILALAEGVETVEELHTVIMLGADLIQGFYTAKPSSEIVASIPDEIKQQIKKFHQEREDGIGQQVYIADCSERILLKRLVQSDTKRIVIGANGNGDVTLEGDMNTDTQLRIETRKDFKGKIILENTWLSSIKNKPCIDIGEDSDVILVLVGENKMEIGGIRVPESSRLTIAGDGKLEIELDSNEYYGIGNGISHLHGELVFEQSGRIAINARGNTGIAIGSGNGGIIRITAGQYRLNLQGDVVAGIGSLYADNELTIHDCDIGMEMTAARGTAIGSIGKDQDINIYKTSAKIFMTGIELAGIGTLDGGKMKFSISEASCFIKIKGECCSAIAALEGESDIHIKQAAVRLTVSGKQALGIGGFTGETSLDQSAANTYIELNSSVPVKNYIERNALDIKSDKFVLIHNGEEIINI